MEKISVIVPCFNEEKYIADFLESMILTDYPKEYLEVLIIDGISTDKTQSIVQSYQERYGFINLLINKNKTVPFALNKGIKAASGNYIIRLDAHSEIPKNYFSELIHWSKKLNADNIGTVCYTDVKNKNLKSNAIKKVLSNRLGVGNSHFRIGTNQIMEVDTVPFGCYKKEIFNKIGLFNTRLTRNQDIELNKRISRVGGKIFLLPNIYSVYFARETYIALAKNNFSNGLWNILTVFITKNYKSLSPRHFVPLIFLVSIVLPLIISLWIPYVWLFSGASVFCYTVLISVTSSKINDKTTSFIYILFAFITLHFSYGVGSLIGLSKINYFFND